MTDGHEHRDQEAWIELPEVARTYVVEVQELEIWIVHGFLRHVRSQGSTRLIAAIELERVATLIRLTRVVGLDLTTIRLLHEAGDLPGLA